MFLLDFGLFCGRPPKDKKWQETKTNESSKTNTSYAPAGPGNKAIARDLSIYKNTVKGYIGKAEQNNMPIADLLELEDPALEAKF